MLRTIFCSDSNVTVSAHCTHDSSNNTKNIGITKETFVTYHLVSIIACPTIEFAQLLVQCF